MYILGYDLDHLLLRIFVLLDNLFQQLMQAPDGLVVLLYGIGHHQHIAAQSGRPVAHYFQH